ncbi:MAG TPA: hypothetical protein GXX18_06640 [Bacillales bacterium]|nr:hypothetical protein [Bacillales bacterium]
MDEARKNIVLKEIKYWKEHRLLPEQYCDFLITLYTEGSETGQEVTEKKIFSFKSLIFQLINILIISLFVLTFIVIYFTELSIDLQIGLFTVFVGMSLGGAVFFYKKNHTSFFHIALITGILILFLSSVNTISTIFSGAQIGLIMIILLNCLIWVFLGFRLGIKYLTISGIASALLLITYTFIL